MAESALVFFILLSHAACWASGLLLPLRPARPHNPLPSRPPATRNPPRAHPSAPRHRRRTRPSLRADQGLQQQADPRSLAPRLRHSVSPSSGPQLARKRPQPQRTMAAAAQAAPAGEDWKQQLRLPPKDPRYKTEVRGGRLGPLMCHPLTGMPETGALALARASDRASRSWRASGLPRQACAARPWPPPALRSGSRLLRPCPRVRHRHRPCCPAAACLLLQDVTATKGNSFEDYFLKRCAACWSCARLGFTRGASTQHPPCTRPAALPAQGAADGHLREGL